MLTPASPRALHLCSKFPDLCCPRLYHAATVSKTNDFYFIFLLYCRYKDLETAKKAMIDLNGQVLAGRTVRVSHLTMRIGNITHTDTFVSIGNLDQGWTRDREGFQWSK